LDADADAARRPLAEEQSGFRELRLRKFFDELERVVGRLDA
jgi:hypothetical protein